MSLRARLLVACVAAGLAAAAAATATAQQQTTICHFTGTPGAPYTALTLGGAALEAHREHEEDLIPAAHPCPTEQVLDPPDDPEHTPTPAPTLPPPADPTGPVLNPGGQRPDVPAPGRPPIYVVPETATPQPPVVDDQIPRTPADDVRPEPARPRGGAAPGRTVAPARRGARRAVVDGTLPLTGGEPWLIVMLGAGLIASGTGMRMRLRAR